MKPVLTIGYTKILLPNTNGLQAVIKLLASAVEVEWDHNRPGTLHYGPNYYVSGPVKIEFTLVPEKNIRAAKTEKEPIEIPAKLLLPEG